MYKLNKSSDRRYFLLLTLETKIASNFLIRFCLTFASLHQNRCVINAELENSPHALLSIAHYSSLHYVKLLKQISN